MCVARFPLSRSRSCMSREPGKWGKSVSSSLALHTVKEGVKAPLTWVQVHIEEIAGILQLPRGTGLSPQTASCLSKSRGINFPQVSGENSVLAGAMRPKKEQRDNYA